ncbi:MAG: STAS/SEC14 domain-containing protein [Actinobacteria bacterium]|nr:MAG: STAS/SEC14 domain-containing protein [Actinomycetota bacterium]
MVERMSDMPPGTIGFRVNGDVEREDYTDILRPALQEALDAHQQLRTLYLIEDLDDIEPGALWEDSRLGFDLGVRHRKEWERSAIVTDIHWMARATKLFAWMIPVYPLAELEDAKRWVAG